MHTTTRPAWFATAAFVVAVAAGIGAVGAGTAIEQAAHPPTCYGIGWGCTPDPATMAMFVGMFVGLPTLAVGVPVTWVGWATTRRRDHRAHLAATWAPAVLASLVSAVLWGQVSQAAATG